MGAAEALHGTGALLLAARFHDPHLVLKHTAEHDDADVGDAQVLCGPIRDRALDHPGRTGKKGRGDPCQPDERTTNDRRDF